MTNQIQTSIELVAAKHRQSVKIHSDGMIQFGAWASVREPFLSDLKELGVDLVLDVVDEKELSNNMRFYRYGYTVKK